MMELYGKYTHILACKQNNGVTNKNKQDVWQMIPVAVSEAEGGLGSQTALRSNLLQVATVVIARQLIPRQFSPVETKSFNNFLISIYIQRIGVVSHYSSTPKILLIDIRRSIVSQV